MGDPDHAGWLTAARALALAPDEADALAWLASRPALPDLPAPAPPADLSARPAPRPAAAWHAGRLLARAVAGAPPLERGYHARWLWHLLAPQDPAAWPLVSVVIPVYERHALLLEAVASVLQDGYPRIELCICDDASASDPLPLLAHLGARLRYRRLTRNGGPSVARQAALELARGELVQFLDQDDLLLPGGLTDKVAALAAVPDAELCFSALDQQAVALTPEFADGDRQRSVGGPDCASQEGPRAMIRRQPFLPSAVLVARHRMLTVGFERDLRFHEDRMAFARLGLAGVKCIALRQPRAIRRWLPSSATRVLKDRLGQQAKVLLFLLGEALERPDLWPACGSLLGQLFDPKWGRLGLEPRPEHLATLEQQLRRLEALAAAPPAGLSAAPLLADLAAALGRMLPRDGGSETGRATAARLAAIAALASPPGPADLALWREAPDPATVAGGLRPIFSRLSQALREGAGWVAVRALDQRPFRSIPHPAKRRWKLLAKLARALGEGPARLAARWLG